MSLTLIGLIGIAAMLALLLLGVPIALAMAATGAPMKSPLGPRKAISASSGSSPG